MPRHLAAYQALQRLIALYINYKVYPICGAVILDTMRLSHIHVPGFSRPHMAGLADTPEIPAFKFDILAGDDGDMNAHEFAFADSRIRILNVGVLIDLASTRLKSHEPYAVFSTGNRINERLEFRQLYAQGGI